MSSDPGRPNAFDVPGGKLLVWYLKVQWHHDFPDEPVTLYSEVGGDGYESRKVNLFPGGCLEWADEEHETAHTGLGAIPVPSIAEIDDQNELSAAKISRGTFEALWTQARS
jgi:hypothetical protein